MGHDLTVTYRAAIAGSLCLALPFSAANIQQSEWRVSLKSVGPIEFGMSLEEARAALSDSLPGASSVGCDYVFPKAAPPGVHLMVDDGVIVGVDVVGPGLQTLSDAEVGDSEQRIKELYGSSIEVQPHKYIDGHYLIYVPDDTTDAEYRLVFETDGHRVLRYRAGLLPEILWVEGCA